MWNKLGIEYKQMSKLVSTWVTCMKMNSTQYEPFSVISYSDVDENCPDDQKPEFHPGLNMDNYYLFSCQTVNL